MPRFGGFSVPECSFAKHEIQKNILIAGIIRERKPHIPSGEDVILAGDRVIVIAADQHPHDLAEVLKG
ncbi:MAG: hypothetical protein J6X30_01475 [Clostridia bacterium]|nr:hypothetical protein [Clostridia bacterium]